MFLLIIAASLIAVLLDYWRLKKMHNYREIIVSAGILAVGLTMAVLRMLNVTLPTLYMLSTKGLLIPLNSWVMKWLS
ncbi:hypothetical protein D3C80_1189640 [compost metagenome]